MYIRSVRQFEARLPAKKFRKYVCVGRGDAKDDGKQPRKSEEVAYAEQVPYADGRAAAEAATAIA